MSIAPIVEHDLDLDYWDKTELDISSGLEYNHRFWSAGGADSVKLGGAALEALKKRSVYVEGDGIPNDITPCRAPGPAGGGGKLCMRRDLYRCPIHGPIIPR